MPHSLVLNLVPRSHIYPQYLTGRHLHALFLTLVSSVDEQLGTYLHDSNVDKAFTLSPLQTNSGKRFSEGDAERIRAATRTRSHPTNKYQILQWQHPQAIPAGTHCWWRISLLDDTLFAKLTHLWLNLNPEHPWHLGSADLHITSILGTPQSTQPWANAVTYAQLYEQASQSDRIISLAFSTPTAFRQGQFDTALPTRDSVFNSLLQRWNKYSRIEISHLAIESVFPSYFNINTEIAADSRSKFIGCVGEVDYRLMGDLDAVAIKNINALADFSLYCGVGRKTPMGMGMVRRLNVN